MFDFEGFQKRLENEDNTMEDNEKIFREFSEANLAWRTSRIGSIVERLQPKLISTSYEKQETVCEYPMLDWEINPLGTLHGGIIATMFDNQGGFLTQVLSCCRLTPTSYLNVNYTSPLMPGDSVVITAKATHIGKRMANVTEEARAKSDGRIIATAMVGYALIRNEKSTIKS